MHAHIDASFGRSMIHGGSKTPFQALFPTSAVAKAERWAVGFRSGNLRIGIARRMVGRSDNQHRRSCWQNSSGVLATCHRPLSADVCRRRPQTSWKYSSTPKDDVAWKPKLAAGNPRLGRWRKLMRAARRLRRVGLMLAQSRATASSMLVQKAGTRDRRGSSPTAVHGDTNRPIDGGFRLAPDQIDDHRPYVFANAASCAATPQVGGSCAG